jgi:hypothetical protein
LPRVSTLVPNAARRKRRNRSRRQCCFLSERVGWPACRFAPKRHRATASVASLCCCKFAGGLVPGVQFMRRRPPWRSARVRGIWRG